jgi:hypothetical protein
VDRVLALALKVVTVLKPVEGGFVVADAIDTSMPRSM